ncbi:MAG: hypothetical protein AUG44_05105 [Actinobacteria bacterium 13_1_20CM_3_71_11]|nr:MAG: hypothetical protein AUG44_05105 [Actinobacteria bacterium 13_1_20CM_3_71_11]
MNRWREDTGSLPFAMLVTLVGMTLTLLLVPVVTGQIGSSRENDGSGNGDLAALPCGPLTGFVSTSGPARYKVTVDYYQTDPRGHEQDAAWLAANPPVSCINGGGTQVTPSYALLQALGTDQATGSLDTVPPAVPVRTLFATYAFQITNQNIPGGLIRTYRGSRTLCLDAGSSSPAAGTNVQMQPCVEGSLQQKWAYSTNLSLVLVPSRTAANPVGMCVDAGSPEALNAVAKVQPCINPKTARQQWSIDDLSRFLGTTDGKNTNDFCLNEKNPDTPGSFVILDSKSGGTCSTHWAPDASAGAGAAGPSTGQVVNFAQFGRCLDVTNKDVTYAFEIAWPCKQAPDPTTLTWNEVWTMPTVPNGGISATGPIVTNKSGTLYCLKSPNSTAAGAYYVVVAACPGSPTADEVWTVYGNTGTYETSYRILDKNGYCLAATDQYATNPDLFSNGYLTSKIIMAACSGSTLQKWNAPPNILQSLPLDNIRER